MSHLSPRRFGTLIVAIGFAAILFAAPIHAADAPEGDNPLIPIFDGKSFKGWEGDLKYFRIEDEAIVGGMLDEAIPRNYFLCTTARYDDFELTLKFKLSERANGGVQIRTERLENPPNEVSGYQADLGPGGWWGAIYDEGRRHKKLAEANPEAVKHVKTDQWHDYRILCEGPRIQLWIDGKQTVDYTEKDEKIARSGIIGLQVHGGPPAECWYKDIKLRNLKPEESTSEVK